MTVFGDTNPIKLVAAPTATVATETLYRKQTKQTGDDRFSGPAAEAPVDTSVTSTTDTTSTTTDVTTTTTTTTTATTSSSREQYSQ